MLISFCLGKFSGVEWLGHITDTHSTFFYNKMDTTGKQCASGNRPSPKQKTVICFLRFMLVNMKYKKICKNET